MIHSVFHNSVEDEGTERATTILICNIFARLKFCGQFSCGHWLKIRSMEPIPNEVEKTKQRNSDQDERHEEGPIVFSFSVHAEKLGFSIALGLCRCLLLKTLITNVTKVVRSKNSLKCSTANKFSITLLDK